MVFWIRTHVYILSAHSVLGFGQCTYLVFSVLFFTIWFCYISYDFVMRDSL